TRLSTPSIDNAIPCHLCKNEVLISCQNRRFVLKLLLCAEEDGLLAQLQSQKTYLSQQLGILYLDGTNAVTTTMHHAAVDRKNYLNVIYDNFHINYELIHSKHLTKYALRLTPTC